MNWAVFSYLTPLFLSVIISVGVGIYAWRHRRVAGAIPLTWLAFSEAAWTGGYIFELISPGLEAKIFWDNIQFGGTFVPPLALLAFALQYTGRQLTYPQRTFGLLVTPFFLVGLLIVTDNFHGLIRPVAWLIPGEPFAELTYDFTPTIWIIALYSYGLVLSSLFILIAKFIRPHLLYRLQVGVLILGILVPLGGTIFTIAGITFTAHRDTTPFTFAIGNLIIAWGLFRYRLLDLAPVARDVLTENMSDAMFVLDAHNRVVDLNPAAQALAGRPGFTLIGHPADRVFSNWPDLVEVLSNQAQTRLKLAQGEGESRRYFDSIVSPLRNRRRRPLGHLLVMRDVTELAQTNSQLREEITEREQAEESLRRAHDELETRVIQRTAELRQANEALRQSEARNLGRYHEAEALRQAALALTSTTDLSLLLHRILTELQRVVPYDSASIQLLKGDTLEIIAAHGFDNLSAVIGVRIPAHGEASPNARVITSLEPVILDDTRLGSLRLNQELYNVPAIRSWLGVPLVINERPSGMITLDKHETNFYTQAHAQTALAYAAQAAIALENVRLYQDLQTQMQILQATQAQLVQSERMAALGRLMASIAHEINNPLQAVQGVLGLLGEELEGSRRPEKLDQYLYIADGEIERIAGIVHRMRDFYRPTGPRHGEASDFYRRLPPSTASTTDLPSILESVFLLANKQLQHGKITVEKVLDPALPALPVSPDHLKQVFLNLTLNAIDAMAERGGTLRVCARLDKARLAGSRPQRVVRIKFSDTGMGMPPDVLARLFEPLFSTKEHGSGFGLFTSYQIIQAYEGQISAASEEGRGTTFTILLPVKAKSSKHSA